MFEPLFQGLAKAIFSELSTPFLITLYVGADLPEGDLAEIFNQELQAELFNNRNVRAPGGAQSRGWHLNSLTNDELDQLEGYFEEVLPNFLQGWLELLAAVKAQRAGVSAVTPGNKLQVLDYGAEPSNGSGVVN